MRLCLLLIAASVALAGDPSWTAAERAVLDSLRIARLPPPPASPDNPVADNLDAARFGRTLFFETRLSANGRVACATCHDPKLDFLDGKVRSQGVGTTQRRTMTIAGAGYSPWLFWDGRKDSLWAQALGPLEDPAEHGGQRAQHVRVIAEDAALKAGYERVFGKMTEASTLVFTNLGKAIEAFERRVLPGAAAFDRYVDALLSGNNEAAAKILTSSQVEGLRLFIGKANCLNCHSGPLFTNHDFHNIGLNPVDSLPTDRGRIDGVRRALADEFRCTGPNSRAALDDCKHVKFVKTSGVELVGSFKTPSLRNVAQHAPYMHDGRFTTLRQVLDHYNTAAPTMLGHELLALGLSGEELQQLEDFLHALTAPVRIALPE